MSTVKNYVSQQGLSTLERPRYSAGLLLEDDDLTAAVNYTRNMMRLMFRSLFGCGVICGMDLTARLTCNRTRVEVTVGKGVALDCLGDPIEIPKPVNVTFDARCDEVPEWLWVTVCYIEKCCRPKDISCSPDEHGQIVQTRVMDGFEVRVYRNRPKCACSCEPQDPRKPTKRSDCCDDEEVEEAAASTDAQTRSDKQAQEARAQQYAATVAALGDPGGAYTADPASTLGGAANVSGERVNAIREGRINTVDRSPSDAYRRRLCECYHDHFDGKCDCRCCCPCVLVGKIRTTKTDENKDIDREKNDAQGLFIDRQWVRWIRPVLTGYLKCVQTVSTVVSNLEGTATERRESAGTAGEPR